MRYANLDIDESVFFGKTSLNKNSMSSQIISTRSKNSRPMSPSASLLQPKQKTLPGVMTLYYVITSSPRGPSLTNLIQKRYKNNSSQ